MTKSDPYSLHDDHVLDPPTTIWGSLKYVGPGFILSASIVGSGELIATTLAGAKAGFALMWFIIFSCFVKVAVQLEFGKHAICSGQSTMASFNSLPGPRIGKANWTIWTWLVLMIAKMMQVSGILGTVLLAFAEVFPSLKTSPAYAIGLFALGASVSLLVFQGYYLLIEKISLVLIGAFTLFTLASLIALQGTPMAITGDEFTSGLIPSIPTDWKVILVAMGAFGITGVGGDEIMAYNYWLIEKGYAKYTGPKNESADWARRAKGWIRIMYLDATLAMVAYTAMTVMFYLLGAAVLHRQSLIPEGEDLVNILGNMYTDTLQRPWAKPMFIAGAIVVLYSTLLAALAAWSRLFSDAFGRIGLFDFHEVAARRKAISIAAWIIPFAWAVLFLFIGEPAMMVIIGGLATVVILLIVVFAAIYFRYFQADARLRPSFLYDVALWLSSIAIFLVAAFVVYDKVIMKLITLTATTPE
ncbi:MAG: Nramp family divalent metal transporter [Pirellulaceae bacterium]